MAMSGNPLRNPGQDARNLFYNALFSRWQTDRPDGGWSKDTPTTWTKCGVGLSDTTSHNTPYCAKLVTSGGSSSSWIPISLDATQLQQMKGKWVNFSVWIKMASGQTFPTYPLIGWTATVPARSNNTAYNIGDGVLASPDNNYVYYCIQAGTTAGSQPTMTATEGARITDGTVVWLAHNYGWDNNNYTYFGAADIGKWSQAKADLFVPNNATGLDFSMRFYRQSDGVSAGTYYLAEPCLMVGTKGPRGAVPGQNEFQSSMQVGGNALDWGTAPPNDSRWCIQGDVRFNSGASAGGPAGWMCTTAGPANGGAVWKAMGNLN